MSVETLALRGATEADAESYWRINNHPTVRSVSFSRGSISWTEHLDWFNKSLQRIDRQLYVTVSSDRVVAVSRIDLLEGYGEISVAVDPVCHGCGIGLWTIVETGNAFFRESSEVHGIRAQIKATNMASRAVFEKAGYQKYSERVFQNELTCEYRILVDGGMER